MCAAAKLILALCVVLTRLPSHCLCHLWAPDDSANVTNYAPYNKAHENDGYNLDDQTNSNNGQPRLGNDENNDNQEEQTDPEVKEAIRQVTNPGKIIKAVDAPCYDNSIIIQVMSDYMEYYSSSNYYSSTRKEMSIPYGINPEVSCFKWSGGSAGLAMTRNGVQVQEPEDMNEGAIRSNIPDQQKSEFVCTDVKTGCERSLNISVTHVMDVISPSLVSRSKYKILYGSPMTVSCSGPADARLEITKNGTTLKAERVNKNTIQIFVSEPDYPMSEYECMNLDTDTYDRVHIIVLPVISIRSRNETLTPDYYSIHERTYMYRVTYRDPIEVYCSAPRDVYIIHDYAVVLSEKVNSTTVKFSTSNLKVGDAVFNCIGSEFQVVNEDEVHVIVMLRMDVVSPNVGRFGSRYVVRPGEPLEVVCSGPAAGPLTLSKNDNTVKDVNIVNDTSIKWVINKSEIHDSYDEYVCSSKEVKLPKIYMCGTDPIAIREMRRNQEERHARVIVEVSIPPKAKDFRCVSDALKFLNCSWSALSYGINFTLSYTDNGNTIRACEKVQAGIGPKFCVFDYRVGIKTFIFLMQSCNGLGCTNQSFSIDHLSIVRPAPPSLVTVESIFSREVELRWDLISLDCAGRRLWSHRDFDHKVEYSYSGIVISARKNIECYIFTYCTAFLDLPCPDQLYEARVYHKLSTAVGDEFWSDPRSVTFSTDVDKNKSKVLDPTCNQGPKKTKEVMAYFVQELRQDVRHDIAKIKEHASSLQKKRNEIRTYYKN